MNRPGIPCRLAIQRGSSLVESMIALAIALFMLAGLSAIFISNRLTFSTQSALSKLLNQELMAMNIINNVVQTTGYYIISTPPSAGQTSALELPATAAFTSNSISVTYAAPGQSVYGIGSINGADAISVRAYHNGGNGAMDCTGNASGTDEINSVFSMDTTGNLECSTYDITTGAVVSTAQDLVSGLTTQASGTPGMTLLYGIDPGNTGSITKYVTAANVTVFSSWTLVKSVRVTLHFVNPLYNASNAQGQPATLSFTKVIPIMATL
jgi:type IV pilus assembly protein PilW